MEHDLYLISYNVSLAIATNIPVPLLTSFVVQCFQKKNYSNVYQCYFWSDNKQLSQRVINRMKESPPVLHPQASTKSSTQSTPPVAPPVERLVPGEHHGHIIPHPHSYTSTLVPPPVSDPITPLVTGTEETSAPPSPESLPNPPPTGDEHVLVPEHQLAALPAEPIHAPSHMSTEPLTAPSLVDPSVEPLTPTTAITSEPVAIPPPPSTDPLTAPVTSIESSVEPVTSIESSVEPVTSIESSVEPVTSIESSVEPVTSIESSVEPVTSIESSVEPVTSIESSVEPVTSIESSVEPVTSIESSVEPVTSIESSVEPVIASSEPIETPSSHTLAAQPMSGGSVDLPVEPELSSSPISIPVPFSPSYRSLLFHNLDLLHLGFCLMKCLARLNLVQFPLESLRFLVFTWLRNPLRLHLLTNSRSFHRKHMLISS